MLGLEWGLGEIAQRLFGDSFQGVWVRLQKVDCLSVGVFGGGVGLETSLRGVIGLRVPECM